MIYWSTQTHFRQDEIDLASHVSSYPEHLKKIAHQYILFYCYVCKILLILPWNENAPLYRDEDVYREPYELYKRKW